MFDSWNGPTEAQMEQLGHKPLDGEETLPVIDRARFTPCGYCRRCAIHDDPGGCLEVEAYERELVEAGATAEQIWPNATEQQRGWYWEDIIRHIGALAAAQDFEGPHRFQDDRDIGGGWAA